MYVVMTTAELFQYTGFITGIDGTENTGVRALFGWGGRDLATFTGISQSELDAFEICIPERVARRLRILAPRGEFWISQAVGSSKWPESGEWPLKPVPEAIAPDRPLPEKGKPFQLQLVPSPVDQDDFSCSHMEHEA